MAKLLHTSEFFFPPCNGICSLMNLAVLIAAYTSRHTSREAAEKLPWVGAAFGFGMSVTAYTLTVMVPVNNSLKESNVQLAQAGAGEKEEKEFRRREKKWQRLNYGRSYPFPSPSPRQFQWRGGSVLRNSWSSHLGGREGEERTTWPSC